MTCSCVSCSMWRHSTLHHQPLWTSCVNPLQGWAPCTRSSSPGTPACGASPCRWSATSRSWTTTARRKPTTRRSWRRAGWGPSIWRSWCPAWWLGWSTTTTLTDSVAKVTEGTLKNKKKSLVVVWTNTLWTSFRLNYFLKCHSCYFFYFFSCFFFLE